MPGLNVDPVAVAARAEVHWRRYLAQGAAADRNAAVRLYDQVLPERADLVPKPMLHALVAAYEPPTPDVAENAQYAATLIAVLQRVTDPELLDRVIAVLREVVADARPGDPHRPAYLSDLGLVLQMRYRRAHRPEDLDEALLRAREAVESSPSTDSSLPAMRSNLAAGLLVRFRRSGDPADLREAVAVARQATAAPTTDDDAGLALRTLSDALRLLSDSAGDPGALDEAISTGRAAVAATPVGSRGFAGRSSQLAVALLSRFERSGGREDLGESVALLRRALAACDTPLDRRRLLLNLSTVLQTRHAWIGESADLDAAIDAATSALDGADGDEAAAISTDLSAALLVRHERTRQRADVRRAVELGREALANTPGPHIARAGRAANLGNALRRQFEAEPRREHLDEAVSVLREAVALAAADFKVRFNLAGALWTRYERYGDRADRDESVRWYESALDAAGPLNPARASILSGLGLALRPTDRPAAVASWQEAARLGAARSATRLGAALQWASTAAADRDWTSATEAYTQAVGLLPVLASRAVSRGDREFLLRRSPGLGRDACASALLEADPDRAVRLADQGRGVLWSQLLEVRTDLGAVAAVAPELAARLASVGAALDHGR